MGSPIELEDRAAGFCHTWNVHAPVNPFAIATAQDLTTLPWGSAPPRAVRGVTPIFHCRGNRGICPHKSEGCDARDQAWQVMLELSHRYLREAGRNLRVLPHYVERFARAVLLPGDEFLEDVELCGKDVPTLLDVHEYAPEAVIRERLIDLGEARSFVVAI